MHFNHRSIAEIPEQELVSTLMSCSLSRADLTRIRDFPDEFDYFTEVPINELPGNPVGDIDILLVPSDTSRSVAIEVKRVKIGHDSYDTGQVNKLTGLNKGVQQANRLAKLGFNLAYLYVFVVVDSRSRNIGKYGYEGMIDTQREAIDDAVSPARLTERVGMLKFDFTQPNDEQPLGIGSTYGGTSLVRMGARTEQPKLVTEWVDWYLASRQDTKSDRN